MAQDTLGFIVTDLITVQLMKIYMEVEKHLTSYQMLSAITHCVNMDDVIHVLQVVHVKLKSMQCTVPPVYDLRFFAW